MFTLHNYKYDPRSNGDHSQQVGIINLISNLQGIYDAVKEIGDAKGFSKKGTIMYLANKTDAIRNLIKALGGPDIFNENFSNWLGAGMNISSLAELVGMYGSSGLLGPIGALISSYAGLYTTYLELYDEHINAYFGNCKAEIDKITSNTNRLNIDVNISGYEASYVNIECGVIVQEKSSSDPRYSDGASTKTVTNNGNLNKDGTAKSTKTGDDVNGHWTLSSSGVVNISITRAIDSYYYIHYTGHEWNGKVDNIYNPTKITGTFSTWNYNGNGYFDGPSRKMEMTR